MASLSLKPPQVVPRTIPPCRPVDTDAAAANPEGEGAASAPVDETNDGAEASKPEPGLYIVATPIGHPDDITIRAIRLLAAADLIACEDTRVTRKLLARHGIATSLTSYHEHNAERARPELLARIGRGEAVALVADAGLPLISDPGYKLVRAARDAGLFVTCLPGPSAPLTALVLSALPTDRFLFAGFPPSRSAARRTFYGELAAVPATLVVFEAARRLADSLTDAAAALGDREAAVARELTKRFEEVVNGRLGELAERYRAEGPPKGEVVVAIGAAVSGRGVAATAVDEQLRDALGKLSLRDAVDRVAGATGWPRRDVYRRALALARGDEP